MKIRKNGYIIGNEDKAIWVAKHGPSGALLPQWINSEDAEVFNTETEAMKARDALPPASRSGLGVYMVTWTCRLTRMG